MMTLEMGLFFPLLSAVLLTLFSYVLSRRIVSVLACSSLLGSFICFLSLLFGQLYASSPSFEVTLFNWIPLAGLQTSFTLHLDHLSLLLSLIVTGIGLIIHLYSIGYSDHEEDFARFFACLNLFVFFMLLLLLSADLLLFFVGWEGVGSASYLLIGFWYHKPSAAKAAKKAFIVNRIGDVGLLLGLLLTFHLFGTSHITTVITQAQTFALGAPVISLLAFLYFLAAMGKSAQFPLHVWLADAMEGPTPVSALIHAATMVNAGVYLVLRMHTVFELAPAVLHLVSYVGIITALFASLCALRQTDLKRVLAYSTVSQLGLMFLGCGTSALFAAIFHLTMHAFAKALLFLSAGNVVHMLHGETEMSKMGALSRRLPITNILFLIGVLCMSGIPPLAIFFSKDLILEEVYLEGKMGLYWIGLSVSVLTAFYLMRAYWLTFKAKSITNHETTSEAPAVMWLPVTCLAAFALFAGALGFSLDNGGLLSAFLKPEGIHFANEELSHGFHINYQIIQSVLAAFLGLFAAYCWYGKGQNPVDERPSVLNKAFYIDSINHSLIVQPTKAFARFINRSLEPAFEKLTLECPAVLGAFFSKELNRLQNGQLRQYVAWMILGTSLFIILFLIKVTHV